MAPEHGGSRTAGYAQFDITKPGVFRLREALPELIYIYKYNWR